MAGTNIVNIGLEEQICDAAYALQGNLDTPEFKTVILLKYISSQLESKYNKLAAGGKSVHQHLPGGGAPTL